MACVDTKIREFSAPKLFIAKRSQLEKYKNIHLASRNKKSTNKMLQMHEAFNYMYL